MTQVSSSQLQRPRRVNDQADPIVFAKVPPQDLESESAVLGAIMLEPEKLDVVLEILSEPECFYKPVHQIIYAAICDLRRSSSPVDILTVTDRLRKNGELELAGGAYYITSLTMNVVTAAHVETHAALVLEKYLLRELIRSASETLQAAYEPDALPHDLIAEAGKQINELADVGTTNTIEHYAKAMQGELEAIERAKNNPGTLTGVDTGLYDVNRITGGWQNTDLIILAARPSQGKTALALELCHAAATSSLTAPVPVLLFSLEMSNNQIARRRLVADAVVNMQDAKVGTLDESEVIRLHAAAAKAKKVPFYLDDRTLTMQQLAAKARRMKRRRGIGLIVVDYLQLLHGDKQKGGSREQEVAGISRALKQLAKELKVPIIALSQLSRSVEQRGGDKRPQLSDLRESGAVEQDADVVVFIWHTTDAMTGQPKNYLVFAKNRNGETRDVEVMFHAPTQRWLNYGDDLSYKGKVEYFRPAQEMQSSQPIIPTHSFDPDLPF